MTDFKGSVPVMALQGTGRHIAIPAKAGTWALESVIPAEAGIQTTHSTTRISGFRLAGRNDPIVKVLVRHNTREAER